MMSTMELEGLCTDAPPSVTRCLWSPGRWAISLASLLVASCGHFPPDRGGDAPQDAPAPPDAAIEGLVAWYPMDVPPMTDGTFVDASRNGHDGTCDPDLGQCPKWDGGAYTFDGVDDWFKVESKPELGGEQGFTIMGWFHCIQNQHVCIVNKGYGSSDENSWQACLDGMMKLEFISSDFNTLIHDMHDPVDTAQWHHLALSWNGSTTKTTTKTKTILFDGHPTSVDGVDIAFDDADITIGSDIHLSTGQPDSPFKGQIADVRIYNRALPNSDIRDIMKLSPRYPPQ